MSYALTRRKSKTDKLYPSFLKIFGIIFLFFSPTFAYSKVTIVYTSNQPNILFNKNVAHFPQLSTLLNNLRSNDKNNTLFLQGGDNFAPSAVSMFDNASNIIALANMMATDLYSVGKRELIYDVDVLSLRAHEAQFPIVSSNLKDIRTGAAAEGLFEIYDFDVDDINISVASIINKRVTVAYSPKYVELSNLPNTLTKITTSQKAADLKVLMTDLEEKPSLEIAQKYNFDLIFVAIDGPDRFTTVNNTLVVFGGGQDGDSVLVNYDPASDITLKAIVKPLSQYAPDPKIMSFIKKYETRIANLHQEIIAVTKSKFTTQKEIIRTRETALGNIFADAIKEKNQTQIAIINSGAIRNSRIYPVGYKITRGDIQSELPFGGHHVSVELTGSVIMEVLENSLSRIKHIDGRFLNVSGIKITYNSKSPVGKRVKSVTIGRNPIEMDKIYSVAIPEFFHQGGDGFTMLKDIKTINSTFNTPKTWHVIAQYLSELKEIEAEPLGRMVDIAENEK